MPAYHVECHIRQRENTSPPPSTPLPPPPVSKASYHQVILQQPVGLRTDSTDDVLLRLNGVLDLKKKKNPDTSPLHFNSSFWTTLEQHDRATQSPIQTGTVHIKVKVTQPWPTYTAYPPNAHCIQMSVQYGRSLLARLHSRVQIRACNALYKNNFWCPYWWKHPICTRHNAR